MKHHMSFKFLAVVVCAFTLLVSLASGICVAVLLREGLYNSSLEEVQEQSKRDDLNTLADSIATKYAAANLSNCPKDLIENYALDKFPFQLPGTDLWYFTMKDEGGHVLSSNYTADGLLQIQTYEFLIRPEYPVVLDYYTVDGSGLTNDDFFPSLGDPNKTPTNDPDDPTTESMPDNYLYTFSYRWHDDTANMTHVYKLAAYRGPMYLVTLYLHPGAYEHAASLEWELMELGQQYRYALLSILFASTLIFAITLVYLCCAAGRRPKNTDLNPGGLNLLPLDIYALLAGYAVYLELGFLARTLSRLLQEYPIWITVFAIMTSGFLVCLVLVGLFFAIAAQTKLRTGYWWRHCAICWLLNKLRQGLLAVLKLLRRLFGIIPALWQWLLPTAILAVALPLTIYLWIAKNLFLPAMIVGLLCIAWTLYCAYCFCVLLAGAKRMSQGNLNAQISAKHLNGPFARFAGHLNALADVAVVAAQKQMTSERMKAELVTNVSHDIKTPLTSIINYVDLLQKAHSAKEASEYLEVLDRQSQRMKKLIDDLTEMSKASTGNMSVDIVSMDAAETVNQALGEFSEKLSTAELIPVFTPPEEPLLMRADGRLTWRVLSNLLSNAVKYALPGTRLYINMVKLDGKILISLKNISKEPLNVDSDELMERFVRGDVSRNTEGSGLGLNIAKSLMELQHGQLQLLVDGDLFKATLVFPEA